MKLSIFIPTFNRPLFFNQLIDSIEGQHDGVEVVASLNGSGEGYRLPSWVRVIRQATNIGGRVQWMLGPLVCSGEYVWMMGDDDRVAPGGVSAVLEALDGDPGIVLNQDNWYDLGVPLGTTFNSYRDVVIAQVAAGRPQAVTSGTLCAAMVFRREGFSLEQAVLKCDTMYGQHYAILHKLMYEPVHVVPRASFYAGSSENASIYSHSPEVIAEHMAAYPKNIHDIIHWLNQRLDLSLDPNRCWVGGDGFDSPWRPK